MNRWFRTLMLLAGVFLFPALVESLVRHYNFNVVLKNTTKLCATKAIATVNGQFPGPTLYAREDDAVIVRVTNHITHNATIHWHGVRQFLSGWSDGPAYITQCPIQPGQNFIYSFNLTGQRGTLLWHAHISWLRATLHGAIVILPKRGIPYPFPKPHKEKIIVLAEWWKADVEAVVDQATQSGLPPNISDSHTINGHPGPVPGCSSQGGYTLHVESGETYLLRIVNAAVNDEMFFKIAGHNLTVVEVDASYTKPFQTDTIFISPGQTTNALLAANQAIGKYLITVTPFMDAPVGLDNLTNYATLRYKGTSSNPLTILTTVPPLNATPLTHAFMDSLRSLNSKQYPTKVPLILDHSLFFFLGVGVNPCATCVNGSRLVADVNNVSFVMPTVALLQAHYFNIKGVFTDDFPGNPIIPFNYTGNPPSNIQTMNGTRLYRLDFNSTVQVVLQGTSVIAPENHPTHLHGFNFFVVGKGLGNFDPYKDPLEFNLVDPVERNTIAVPTAGWIAIRFRADNPESNWFLQASQSTEWTREENKKFERALAIYDETTPDRWIKVAEMIPGKTVWDVIKQYKELEDDVSDIESGRVPIPGYLTSSFKLELVDNRSFDAYRRKSSTAKGPDQERKKGVPWTEEEHRQFLMGLLKYGKGDWRNISRNYVITKSPTQVASHAQKYFIRQLSGGKDKRRPSIHDITIVNLTETSSGNNKPPSHDQSFVLAPQQKPSSIPRMSPDWNQPRDEAVMIFDSDCRNLSISPPYEFKGQGHNLYGSAPYGFHTKPYIQTQSSIHQIRK